MADNTTDATRPLMLTSACPITLALAVLSLFRTGVEGLQVQRSQFGTKHPGLMLLPPDRVSSRLLPVLGDATVRDWPDSYTRAEGGALGRTGQACWLIDLSQLLVQIEVLCPHAFVEGGTGPAAEIPALIPSSVAARSVEHASTLPTDLPIIHDNASPGEGTFQFVPLSPEHTVALHYLDWDGTYDFRPFLAGLDAVSTA